MQYSRHTSRFQALKLMCGDPRVTCWASALVFLLLATAGVLIIDIDWALT
jgi:hypothetical protein